MVIQVHVVEGTIAASAKNPNVYLIDINNAVIRYQHWFGALRSDERYEYKL